jgi:hypothetical protein
MIQRTRILGFAVVILAVSAVWGGTAQATSSATCNTVLNATFDPGLGPSASSQLIKVHGTLTQCGRVLRRGHFHGRLQSTAALSCQSSGGTAKGQIHITWKSGATSTVKATATFLSGAQVGISGTVKDGELAGDTVSGTLTVQSETGNCVSAPITAATFTGSLAL